MGKILFLFFVIILLCTTTIYSQSIFIEKGENAFEGGTLLGFDEDIFESGGHLDFSINGTVDLGLYIGGGKVDDEDLGEMGFFSVSPGVEGFLIKQNDDIPLSLSAFFSLSFLSYFSDDLNTLDWELSSSGYSLGFSVYHKCDFTEKISMISTFSLGMIYKNVELDMGNGLKTEEDETSIGIEIAIPFSFNIKENTTIVVPLGFDIDDTETMLILGVSTIYKY